jgi:hypothetical protein
VLAILVAVVATTASGRLGSADAGAQLAVAQLIVNEGSVSVEHRPDVVLWFPGRDGRFYQGNDIGNVLLMLPSVLASTAVGRPYTPGGVPDQFPRVATSATVALVVVVGLLALFAALRLLLARERPALWLTLLFLFGTFFGAYAKTAYDVVGATCGTCVVLWLLIRAMQAPAVTRRDIAVLAITVAVTGLFRASYAPFLSVGVIVALAPVLPAPRRRPLALFLVVLVAGSCPTLLYDWARTGNPLLPLNAAASGYGLSRPLLDGLYGVILSVRKGLLFAAPLLVFGLVLLARRPSARRQLLRDPAGRGLARLLWACAAYVVFVALLDNPEPTAWGPRYLLPITPIIFLAISPALVDIWSMRLRAVAVVVLAVGLVIGCAPILTAWNDDLVEYRRHISQATINDPVPQKAVATAIADGLTGSPRYDGPFVLRDGGSASIDQHFPDFWWRQALSQGALPGTAALALLAVLWGAACTAAARASLRTSGS